MDANRLIQLAGPRAPPDDSGREIAVGDILEGLVRHRDFQIRNRPRYATFARRQVTHYSALRLGTPVPFWSDVGALGAPSCAALLGPSVPSEMERCVLARGAAF